MPYWVCGEHVTSGNDWATGAGRKLLWPEAVLRVNSVWELTHFRLTMKGACPFPGLSRPGPTY